MRVRRITISIEEERRFIELWTGGVAVMAICVELGLTEWAAQQIRKRLRLTPRKPSDRAAQEPLGRDPTPTEIRAATRALRERHLARRRAEQVQNYRRDEEVGGRHYPDSVFGE
jgi:hypothetical protein